MKPYTEAEQARHAAVNAQFLAQLQQALTNGQVEELRRRNEARAAEARAALGPKWLLHPSNRVKRKAQGRTA
ncbi:MAG: hypothetical protein IIZ92_03335 [Aquincola sp.]|nr:hypothetical protein [Aquincola sp.]